MAAKPSAKLFDRLAPLMFVALIMMSFVIGALWQKVNTLTAGTSTTGTTTTTTAAAPTPQPVSLDTIKGLFGKDLIKFGDANRKVLLVEVADPSCPYCHAAAGKNPELNKQIGTQFTLVSDGGSYVAPVEEFKKLVDSGKASYVYVYSNGHGNGEMGQKAMYCGFEKNKFWQVHDLLMTNAGYNLLNNTIKNDKTKSGDLANFLKTAVPVAEMKACLDSGKYDNRISSDQSIATSLGVGGTPGFFVNTNAFPGAYSYKDMESIVTSALQ
jgi:protein-disulfide isomerase